MAGNPATGVWSADQASFHAFVEFNPYSILLLAPGASSTFMLQVVAIFSAKYRD